MKNIQAFPRPIIYMSASDVGDIREFNREIENLQLGGMTLRDYFAAKILQGILSGTGKISIDKGLGQNEIEIAFDMADSMLKERDK